MKHKSMSSFFVISLVMLLSCTGYAEDTANTSVAAAKKTVTTYLRAETKNNFATIRGLLTDDAHLKYTYEWGHGYEDSVYEFDLSKPSTSRDSLQGDNYADRMNGYETIERTHRIKWAKPKAEGVVEVYVLATEKYRYDDYTGTAKTTMRFLVREVAGTARITRLASVTTY